MRDTNPNMVALGYVKTVYITIIIIITYYRESK